MSVHQNLVPYLGFRSTAREALTFYQQVFGGELNISVFSDFGEGSTEEEGARVMHGQLIVDGQPLLMASDTPDSRELPDKSSTTIALFGGQEDNERLRGYWAALADGGTITLPLQLAPWGDAFGELNDRFGTPWFVNIAA